jgi:hypothetical protein
MMIRKSGFEYVWMVMSWVVKCQTYRLLQSQALEVFLLGTLRGGWEKRASSAVMWVCEELVRKR